MQRTPVEIDTMRIIDLAIGDVINRDPTARGGWFVVDEIRRLPSGEINVTSPRSRESVMGTDHDIVGVQVPKVVERGGE